MNHQGTETFLPTNAMMGAISSLVSTFYPTALGAEAKNQ